MMKTVISMQDAEALLRLFERPGRRGEPVSVMLAGKRRRGASFVHLVNRGAERDAGATLKEIVTDAIFHRSARCWSGLTDVLEIGRLR